MRRLSGFSLMEMMVVLLIVAVVAAASAPMVNKKMMQEVGEKSPWVWIGMNGSIGYNLTSEPSKIAMIGTNNAPPTGALLHLDQKNIGKPQIALGVRTNQPTEIGSDRNGNIWIAKRENNIAQITSGQNSVAIGTWAKTLSNKSIAIGDLASTPSHNSVAIGYGANSGSMANNNIAIGYKALIKQGQSNAVVIGSGAQVPGAGGIGAIAIGAHSSTKSGAVAIGLGATSSSVAIGAVANSAAPGYPIAIGSSSNTYGAANAIAIGYRANAITKESIAIGPSANTTNADNSVAIGPNANTTNGREGIAIGANAVASGDSAIAIGSLCGVDGVISNTTARASSAIAIGDGVEASALEATAIGKGSKASGQYSISMGRLSNAKATNSIAIGRDAKVVSSTHYNSVAIGKGAETSESNQIVLGNSNTTVYIPGRLIVKGGCLLGTSERSNDVDRVYLNVNDGDGNVFVKTCSDDNKIKAQDRVEGAALLLLINRFYTASDKRLKNVGKEFNDGLTELKKLKLYHYTYKNDKTKTPHVGVMAQDLQKIFPDAVFKGEDGFLRIRMEDMFYALVNAVKELDNKIELLKNEEVFVLKKRVSDLEKQNKDLLKRLEALEKKVN